VPDEHIGTAGRCVVEIERISTGAEASHFFGFIGGRMSDHEAGFLVREFELGRQWVCLQSC